MTSTRQLIWWLLFGAGLIIAMAGWMWIMVRLVRSETEAAEARVRQAEERLLSREAAELSSKLEAALESRPSIPDLAKSGTFAGIWQTPQAPTSSNPAPAEIIDSWRARIREGKASAADIANALESGELTWGWVEDGRDAVAGLLLYLFRNGDRSPALGELLSERVWNFSPPALSPAFRLTLIRPLLELQPSGELERLLQIELIRAAQGRPELLDNDYEVFDRIDGDTTTRTFWTQNQILSLLDQADDYHLLETVPEERVAVSLRGFQRWRYLATRSTVSATDSGSRSLVWIGGASGLALVALAITALLIGRHQLRLARLRTDLAASVAHELRTPLAGQRLLLESLIENDKLSPTDRADYLRMAFRENKRLSRLGEEFLTFSRLERGVLQLELQQVELPELLEDAIATLRRKADADTDTLSLDLSAPLPPVQADPEALATVLRNLLENAWKYSEAPRRITLSARAENGEVIIAVRDQGIGLSSRDQRRIFRQFFRVDRRLARQNDGLGLGLSIVHRLVSTMHGRIELNSELGKGSEFRILLRTSP